MQDNLIRRAGFITTEIPYERSSQTPQDPWQRKEQGWDLRTAPHPYGAGLPFYFRDFSLEEIPAEATLRVSALGCFEVFCNGQRVKNGPVYDEMKPGSVVYSKRTLYYTYSLLPYLAEGSNRLLVVASDGWYTGNIAFGTYPKETPSVIACLDMETKEGTRTLVTDSSWLSAVGGQIRYTDIWDGEYTDLACASYASLSVAGTEIEGAVPAVAKETAIEVTPHIGECVQIRPELELTPKGAYVFREIRDNGTDFGEAVIDRQVDFSSPIELKAGEKLVVDMGQNMVGRERLTIVCSDKAMVQVRFGEMLNDSGDKGRGNDGPKDTIYAANYRWAKSKSQYLLSGDENTDTCTPLFTFYGFRYMEITASEDLTLLSVQADVMGSALPETGTLSTSHPLVNQLISNIRWGQRGNYLSIPTDCPQRDERLGWTGDTQIFCRTGAYQANVRGFFHKWMQDARDSQHDSGAYPDVIPCLRIFARSSAAAWGDAGIIVPYTVWLMYGDRDIIEENWDSMTRYMEHLGAKEDLSGPESRYLDWLAFDPTQGDYISMCYYTYDASLMSKMAKATGREDEALAYEALCGRIREAFRAKHTDENGLPKQKTQTAYILALKMRMLNEDKTEQALADLRRLIVDNGYRLSTGFVGTGALCQTLSEFGQDDLAYDLLLQTECPSWLYSVNQGATTIWERWNSYTLESGFGDVNMNSFNHYAYGSVAEWMYRYMIGIEAVEEAPGFGRFVLQPRPDLRPQDSLPEGQENITSAEGSYRTACGTVKSGWEYKEGVLTYRATVPAGSTARLYLPTLGKSSFVCNGQTSVIKKTEGGCASVLLFPGSYTFTV